jgi:hypothetical protein
VCNFSGQELHLAVVGTEVVVGVNAERIEDGLIALEPLAGALVR